MTAVPSARSLGALGSAEAADLACREDPLDFKTDKRGRTRQVFDSILEGARLGSDERRLKSGYSGVDAGGPPRRIEAHRIAMPENACAVPLCKWLCSSLLESFNWPDSPDCEPGAAGCYFGADPVQWRACLRRMARARLLGHNDWHLELSRWRRTTETDSLVTVRTKKSG